MYKIQEEVIAIYNTLKEHGFEVFFVGGCVRDLLMGRPVKDWDITTNATPEQIQEIFSETFYDNTFGTVGVVFEEKKTNEEDIFEKKYVEVTTYRLEEGYSNLRHPEKVEWGESIEDDLSRRDFTMNAIAASITQENDGYKFEFVDPFNGRGAIEKKEIIAVRDPNERFNEDALRIMRAIRFAAQLGFVIEKTTYDALKNNASNILKISGERVRDELLKILASDRHYEGIMLLDECGVLDLIFPELAKGKGVSQVRPGRHHTTDVFTHNVLSLKHTPSQDPIVRLATLLHDVGKPFVASQDSEGHIIFYNHEVKGAEIAFEIAQRLKLSKKQREKITKLIRWHMFTIDENITDSAVRRFIRRVGLENVSDMIDLRIGDRLGGGTEVAESWRLKKFKERIEKELNPPFSISDLSVNGNDIMQTLSIPPGPKVGEILQKLFDEVDEDLSKNNKEYLLNRIKELQ